MQNKLRAGILNRSFQTLALAVLLLTVAALPAEVLKFAPERKGLAAVTDPAASGKRAVAINVETDSGKVVLGALKKPLAPGLYRFNSRLRLHLPADYDAARLRLTLAFVVDGKAVAQAPLLWPHFNSRPGAYTEFAQTLSFTQPAAPTVELSWAVAPLPAGEKPRFVRPQKGPSIDDANKKPAGKGGNDLGDLVGELQADVAVPLASITYPAVLADQLTFSAESTTLAVEKVWPE